MTNGDLFDPVEAELRRIEGSSQAAQKRPNSLDVAKRVAVQLAQRTRGAVTIDDVYAELDRLGTGIGPDKLGNAAGSVFAGKRWECVGFTSSKRAARRTGMVRRWVLRAESGDDG